MIFVPVLFFRTETFTPLAETRDLGRSVSSVSFNPDPTTGEKVMVATVPDPFLGSCAGLMPNA